MQSPRVSFLISIIGFFAIACGGPKGGTTSNEPISSITIQQLRATDLSEDRHTLSSKKDEILLLYYYIKNDQTLLKSQYFGFYDITLEDPIMPLDIHLDLPDLENTRLVLALIEKDMDRSPSDIDRIFQANFHLLNGIESQKEALQLKLADDDLLDLKILNLKKESVRRTIKLKFWGVHLFDSYEYFIDCNFD